MEDRGRQTMGRCWRAAIILVSVVLMAASYMLAFQYASQKSTEWGQDGKITRITESPRNQTELAVLAASGALCCLIWGLSGVKISQFSAGPISMKAPSTEVGKAASRYSKTGQNPKEVRLERSSAVSDVQEECPDTDPQTTVKIKGEDHRIYSLDSIPWRVLGDLFTNWPREYPIPRDLSTFEFAARKDGKGNHPWIIKFRDNPAYIVSYGGHGKSTSTVQPT